MLRIALACLCLLPACGDDSPPSDDTTSSSTTSSEESSSTGVSDSPRIQATIDATASCDAATMLTFTATRFACVGAGPCTIPDPPTEIMGTTEACPSDAGETTFTVELMQGGRYHVELLVTLSNGTTLRECYSTDGSGEVEVTSDHVDTGAAIEVTADGSGACPLD